MARYFIKLNGEERGPYSLPQVREMWSRGAVLADTPCLQIGTESWITVEDLEDELIGDNDGISRDEPKPSQGRITVQTIGSSSKKSDALAGFLGLFLGPVGLWYKERWAAGLAWLVMWLIISRGGSGIVLPSVFWLGMCIHALVAKPAARNIQVIEQMGCRKPEDGLFVFLKRAVLVTVLVVIVGAVTKRHPAPTDAAASGKATAPEAVKAPTQSTALITEPQPSVVPKPTATEAQQKPDNEPERIAADFQKARSLLTGHPSNIDLAVALAPLQSIKKSQPEYGEAQELIAKLKKKAKEPPAGDAVTLAGYLASPSEEIFLKAVSYSVDKDRAALDKLIAAGLVIYLKGGIQVAIVDEKVFGGRVKIRPMGHTLELWTYSEAIKHN